jgi:hypothetical protein
LFIFRRKLSSQIWQVPASYAQRSTAPDGMADRAPVPPNTLIRPNRSGLALGGEADGSSIKDRRPVTGATHRATPRMIQIEDSKFKIQENHQSTISNLRSSMSR